jgi:hypothetical protein
MYWRVRVDDTHACFQAASLASLPAARLASGVNCWASVA